MEQVGAFADSRRHPSDAELSIRYAPKRRRRPRRGLRFDLLHVPQSK